MPSTMKARKALLRGPPRPRRLRRLRWEWVIAESLSVGASEASTSGREPLARDLLVGAPTDLPPASAARTAGAAPPRARRARAAGSAHRRPRDGCPREAPRRPSPP